MLPWSWAEERLAGSRNYWLSTTRPNGRPHAMPVWGLWRDGAFWFGSDKRSVKSRNLAANASAVAHLESGDEAVIVEGVVSPVTDADLLRGLLEAFGEKYGVKFDPADVVAVWHRLTPTVAFGWTEADYPNNATRWEF